MIGSMALVVAGVVLLAVVVGLLVARRAARRDPPPVVPVPPEEDDRRKDVETRERIAQLEQRYRHAVRSLVIGLGVLSVCVVVALAGVTVLLDRLQDSRVRTLREACERNKDAVHVASGKFPDLGPFFRHVFPFEDDCQGYAERRANAR